MKALVTGATGFVGSHVVEALLRRGDEVRALVRTPGKAAGLAGRGVTLIAGDLHDDHALGRASDGVDVIYHIAGAVAARDEAAFLHANRDGTAKLIAAASRAGRPRVVHVSSLAAAGPSRAGYPLRGDEAPHPVTAYGRSKLAGERVVAAASLPWTIVRPPMVYGPRDREVLKVFRLARARIAPVFGDGSQLLSAVHGGDLADALIAAATAEDAVGRTYYACHPEIFTSADFVRAVAESQHRRVVTLPIPARAGQAALTLTEASSRLLGKVTILTRDKANEFFQAAWTADPGRLTTDTGWRAVHDLRSGLADTYQWYLAAGWLVR